MPHQEKEMQSKALAQTYVWHEGKGFFVSTIDRESSAMYAGVYAETMAWEWDSEERVRGELVGQDESGQGSIARHMLMVQRLYETGRAEPADDGA